MNRAPGSTLLWLLPMALAACGTGSSPGGGVCRAGEPIDCTCEDGRPGTGTCGEDACDCPPRFALVAEPGSLDFGEVAGGTSREAVLLVTNPSPRAVGIRAQLQGADAAAFALPDGLTAAISAGATLPLVVRFTPGLPGTPVARLRLEADDADVAAVEATLTARVPGPLLVCSPPSVNFANAWLGEAATAVVICANAGLAGATDEAWLSLEPFAVTGEAFSAAWTAAPPAGLAVGESAAIEVGFAPVAAGEHYGTLTVTSDHGTVEVPLAGLANEPEDCDVVVLPEVLSMGIAEPGRELQREIAIRNRRPDVPCTVQDVRFCEGTDPAFTLVGGPYDRIVLAGGEERRLTLRFAPTWDSCAAPEAQGCLEFDLSPSPDPHRAIPLTCSAPVPSVLIAPGLLDFGALRPGCSTRDRELQLINTGSVPLEIEDLEFEETTGDEFFVRSAPSPGTTLAPGGSAVIAVAYRPVDLGADFGTLLVRFVGVDPPFPAAMIGRGVEAPPQRDHFVQGTSPKLDLLLVIDNGTTMGPEAARLVAELGDLPDRILAMEVDARLAVTTTGLVAGGPGCPGGANGGEDGRFFPIDHARPRILDEHTPNLRATWEANLAVGTCHGAPPQTLEAALRAVTPPLSTSADDPRHPELDDGNLGFLRPDAHLAIIAISDRADASPGTVESYRAAIQALKGAANTHLFNFSAITGDRGSGCTASDGRAAVAGDRLIDLADATEGGMGLSICGGNWSMHFVPASGGFGRRTCFFLGNQPEDRNGDGVVSDTDAELQVYIDGTLVPSSIDGEPVWHYAGDMIAVCFEPGHVPEGGAEVDVDYRVACLPW